MKNSIKRIQSESSLSALLSARILREAKNIVKYISMAVVLFVMAACSQDEMFESVQDSGTLQFVVSDFPGYATTRVIGTPDAGKTGWENDDVIDITFTSPKLGKKTGTLTYSESENSKAWTFDGSFAYIDGETPTITATYGVAGGTHEYLEGTCTLNDNTISISFASRPYSRLRIAGDARTEYTVTTTEFTPAGGDEAITENYTLETNDDGNMFLYGVFAQGATVIVKQGDAIIKEHTFATATEIGTSYVLDAIVKVDVFLDEDAATVIIPEGATAAKITQALTDDVLVKSAIIVGGTLTETQQTALASALESYNGILYLSDMASTAFTAELPTTVTKVGNETGWYQIDDNNYHVHTAAGLQTVLTTSITGTGETGPTVKVMADMKITEQYIDTRMVSYTLDLNGKHIEFATHGLATEGHITIKDSGTSGVFEANKHTITVYSGTLTVESGSIKSTTSSCNALYVDGGNVNISGGKFESAGTAVNIVQRANVTITNGTFIGGSGNAVDNSGSVTISGGTFNNNSAGNGVIFTSDSGATTTIEGNPTFNGRGPDFEYEDGTLNLTKAQKESYTIRIGYWGNTTSTEGIKLPDGWAIFDKNDTEITEFTKGDTYTAKAKTE